MGRSERPNVMRSNLVKISKQNGNDVHAHPTVVADTRGASADGEVEGEIEDNETADGAAVGNE